ncbi:glycosyltransferase family 4 protein [Robertmurraya sp. GLU-23]
MKNTKGNFKKKALVVTTVASTLDQFCMNDINILQKSYNVHIAANFETGNNTSKERVKEFKSELQRKDIIVNEVNFNRNPFSRSNLNAYKKIKRLIECSSFEIIHCHTPIAAMLVRLAARKVRKKGTKVFYTAHGFHFFKGAPLKNWLVYYPVERWLARYTDVLITINNEDYNRAKNSFKALRIEYIPGVGINTNKFSDLTFDRINKRDELDIPENAFVVLSVGELNRNKNHETIIRAISKLNNSNVYYVICGQGKLENYLRNLSQEVGLEKQIKLLGFRNDIAEICKTSDVFAFPSKREGLGLAALEAMASGLPMVTSNIHGIVDYSDDTVTGYTCNPTDVESFAFALKKLIENPNLRKKMGQQNLEIVKDYDVSNVNRIMTNIYESVREKSN